MSYALNATASLTYGDRPAFDGAAKISVSYWLWPAATATGYLMYLHRMKNASGYYSGWGCGTAYGYPRIIGGGFANNQAYSYGYDYGYNSLTAGAWNHVLIVYDGTQGTVADRIKAYVNRSAVPINVGTAIPATLGTASPAVLTLQNDSDTIKLAEVGIWIGTAITEQLVIDQLGAASNAKPPTEVGLTGLAHYLSLKSDPLDSVAGLTPTVTGAVVDVSHPPVVAAAAVPTLSVRVQESQVGGATF